MRRWHVAAVAVAASIGFVAYSGDFQIGILPNHIHTPGVTNPDITQANINETICNPNWSTKTIRPTSSYTTALKKKQLASGYALNGDTNTSDYEEDHLISLELGGNPTDPRNLWPESYKTKPNARDKDRVENYLHAQVCGGTMTLLVAQRAIADTWTKYLPKVQSSYSNSATDD